MNKHTPGPWIVGDEGRGGRIYADDGFEVVRAQDQCFNSSAHEAANGTQFLMRSEYQDNARLIAAAPDLYHAARVARDALTALLKIGDPIVCSNALFLLDAAIQKSEGKQ